MDSDIDQLILAFLHLRFVKVARIVGQGWLALEDQGGISMRR